MGKSCDIGGSCSFSSYSGLEDISQVPRPEIVTPPLPPAENNINISDRTQPVQRPCGREQVWNFLVAVEDLDKTELGTSKGSFQGHCQNSIRGHIGVLQGFKGDLRGVGRDDSDLDLGDWWL